MNVTELLQQTPEETQPEGRAERGFSQGLCVYRREERRFGRSLWNGGLCKAPFIHGCGELGGKRVALGSQCRLISAQYIASIQLTDV